MYALAISDSYACCMGLLFRFMQCFRDRAAENELDEPFIPFTCSDSPRSETGLECQVCIHAVDFVTFFA